jgi:hypothetical protein
VSRGTKYWLRFMASGSPAGGKTFEKVFADVSHVSWSGKK